MNTLTQSPELRFAGQPHHTPASEKAIARTARIVGGRYAAQSSGSRLAPDSKLRLGASVRHAGFGIGQVMAHWPDGMLVVRFEGAAKNRRIWPAHLTSLSGGRD